MTSVLKRLAAATGIALAMGFANIASAEAARVYNRLTVPIYLLSKYCNSGTNIGNAMGSDQGYGVRPQGESDSLECSAGVLRVYWQEWQNGCLLQVEYENSIIAGGHYVIVSSRNNVVTCRVCDSSKNVIRTVTGKAPINPPSSDGYTPSSRYENCDGTSETTTGLVFGPGNYACTLGPGAQCLNGLQANGALLFDADLHGAVLPKSQVILANLQRANLSGASLVYSDLDRADLTTAKLANANMAPVSAKGANFTSANLLQANLAGSNLSNANFSSAILYNASLSQADLSGANLTGANLSFADLRGAKLTGATLTSAILTSVNLSGATMPDGKVCAANSIGVCK
jgi:uncharacterized protein YjbI with pentapeptide repeats